MTRERGHDFWPENSSDRTSITRISERTDNLALRIYADPSTYGAVVSSGGHAVLPWVETRRDLSGYVDIMHINGLVVDPTQVVLETFELVRTEGEGGGYGRLWRSSRTYRRQIGHMDETGTARTQAVYGDGSEVGLQALGSRYAASILLSRAVGEHVRLIGEGTGPDGQADPVDPIIDGHLEAYELTVGDAARTAAKAALDLAGATFEHPALNEWLSASPRVA